VSCHLSQIDCRWCSIVGGEDVLMYIYVFDVFVTGAMATMMRARFMKRNALSMMTRCVWMIDRKRKHACISVFGGGFYVACKSCFP